MRYLGKVNNSGKVYWPELGIALLPILRYFRSPIEGLSFGNLMLYCIFGYVFIKCFRRKIKKINNWFILYLVYIIANFLVMSLFVPGGNGVLVINVLIYLLLVLILNQSENYSSDTFVEYIKRISFVACIVLLIQYFMHYFMGKWFQPFPLSVYTESIRTASSSISRLTTGMASGLFRPASFFNEPAHFAQYVSVGLAVSLYQYNMYNDNKNFLLGLFFSICLLMSTSGIGFITLIVCWLLFFLWNAKRKLSKRIIIIVFVSLILVPLILPYLIKQEYVQIIISRLFTTEMEKGSIYGRSEGYTYLLDLSPLQIIFGIGMGKESVLEPSIYFTSANITIVRSGIIGTLLYCMMLFKMARDNGKLNFVMVILSACIMIMAGVYDFSNLAFYMMIMSGTYLIDKK